MKYLLLFSISVILLQSCFFSAGSYPYAERYEFDMSRNELIEKIDKLKEEYPEYKLITTVENGNVEEVPDSVVGGFYDAFFYIKHKNLTIHCFINMSSEIRDTPVELGLSGGTYSKNLASWGRVNTDDLTKKENAEIKTLFETEILDKLGTWKRM